MKKRALDLLRVQFYFKVNFVFSCHNKKQQVETTQQTFVTYVNFALISSTFTLHFSQSEVGAS